MSDPRRDTLHPHERQKLANYLEPGTHIDQVCGPDALREWSVLRHTGGQVLLGHDNGALAWVDVDADGRVGGHHRLVEGDEARATRARLAVPG